MSDVDWPTYDVDGRSPVSTSSERDQLHERARDDLASVALGESPDRDLADHIAGCAECRADLAAYRDVVGLARGAAAGDEDDVPSPAVWDAIAAAVGPVAPAVVPLHAARPRPLRRALLVAAATVAVLGAAAGGWAIGHTSSSGESSAAQAALQAQPGTADEARGVAAVHRSGDGYQLVVRTYDLPARSGYYEVWMYDPKAGHMVAVGTLGTGGRGAFTLPGGMDLGAYHVVDVSAQRYNGNPAHDRSVLRGPLRG